MAKNADKDMAEKLEGLVAENNERVKKVEQLTDQIEQCKAAINQLKEEHDFTRGKITLLNDLMGTPEEEK
tara:strand:+ start:109 stop:318 length:210 start_codon:yes stop_codon:yes gene_type:complete